MKQIALFFTILLLSACVTKEPKSEKTETKGGEALEITTTNLKNRNVYSINELDVVSDQDFFHYSTINGHVFKKNSKTALWDDKEIDLDIHYNLVFKDQKVYACTDNDSVYNFYEISEIGEPIFKGSLTAEFIHVTFYNFYVFENRILYWIDPEDQKLVRVFDFTERINDKDGIPNDLCGINELSENYIQIEICRFHQGCYDFDAYILDLKNNELVYSNEHKHKESENEMFKLCFFLADEKKKQFYAYFYSSDNYSQEDGFIFNSQFQIIDTIPNKDDNVSFQCAYCEYGTYLAGLNIVDNEIDNYYLGVYYYEGAERIEFFLPYIFNPDLDRALKKVYNDVELNNADIEYFTLYELSIIRNFIFAKHNYRFDKEYYQAYFSTFRFYNSEEFRSSRTKDVNERLSETDKLNLQLIRNL